MRETRIEECVRLVDSRWLMGGTDGSNTKQLRIQRAAAKAENKAHVVMVKQDAKVSAAVQETSKVVRCASDGKCQ